MMKAIHIERIVCIALGLVVVAGVALGDSSKKEPAGVCTKSAGSTTLVATWESDKVCVYKKGEWTLKVEYLHKGSRSEGQSGVLLRGDKPVTGKEKGDVLETSLGKRKHYGTERKVRGGRTGWNFADRRQVKRSSEVPAKPAASKCCGCSKKKLRQEPSISRGDE